MHSMVKEWPAATVWFRGRIKYGRSREGEGGGRGEREREGVNYK